MRAIILTPPSSGAHYTAMILRRLGLRVSHEKVAAYDGYRDDTGYDCGISWKAIGCFDEIPKNLKLFCQLRDIDATAHTMLNVGSFFKVPELAEKFGVEDPADFESVRGGVVEWQEWCRERAEWTYYVEDMTKVGPELVHRLGFPAPEPGRIAYLGQKFHKGRPITKWVTA